MTIQSILNEISTNDPVVKVIKSELLFTEATGVLDRLNDIEQSLQEIRGLMIAKLPFAAGGMNGQSLEEILDTLSNVGVSVYEAEDLPGQFGFTFCDADDYLSMEDAAVAAMNHAGQVQNRNFD